MKRRISPGDRRFRRKRISEEERIYILNFFKKNRVQSICAKEIDSNPRYIIELKRDGIAGKHVIDGVRNFINNYKSSKNEI